MPLKPVGIIYFFIEKFFLSGCLANFSHVLHSHEQNSNFYVVIQDQFETISFNPRQED